MRYSLLLYYPERPRATRRRGTRRGMQAFQAYAAALEDAGVLASAEVLQQSDATTTSPWRRGARRTGRPFADSKEQLGGTFVIDVPDLDDAIEWAGRAPSVSWGHVEIRRRPPAT